MHVCLRLLEQGHEVIGCDNLNDYYDPALKKARLDKLQAHRGFSFHRLDIADSKAVADLFGNGFPRVVHLAAQAGVRYSLENPRAYVDSNIVGFLNILEACRHQGCEHLIFASTSSVYGANRKFPFSEHDNTDHPVSLYAATKKSNELMAHAYSHLFGLPATGLRFFTVYGPWGRPDMSPYRFTQAIVEGKPIDVYNQGNMQRDFTYIDDIVEAVVRVGDRPAAPDPKWTGDDPDPAGSSAPYRIFNIGNHSPVKLMRLIEVLEEKIGKKAIKRMAPMQPGDVLATYADVDYLARAVDFAPRTSIETGIERFVAWYRDFYRV